MNLLAVVGLKQMGLQGLEVARYSMLSLSSASVCILYDMGTVFDVRELFKEVCDLWRRFLIVPRRPCAGRQDDNIHELTPDPPPPHPRHHHHQDFLILPSTVSRRHPTHRLLSGVTQSPYRFFSRPLLTLQNRCLYDDSCSLYKIVVCTMTPAHSIESLFAR